MSQDLVGKLVTVVTAWNKQNQDLLDEILEAPTDRPLKLDFGGDEVTLTGKEIQHFKLGIITAQQLYRNLPFKAEPCDGESREVV